MSDPGLVETSKETELSPIVNPESDGADSSPGLHFCSICQVKIPLRAKHCTELGRCIRTHDHYCSWTGNAVGEFNRPLFLLYLMFQTAALAWFTVNSFAKIAASAGIRTNQIASFTALIIAITVMCIFWLMTSLLVMYHIFLACANLTTWEQTSWTRITYLKDLQQSLGSPFSADTLMANIKQYLRTPGSVALDAEGGIVWHLGIQRSVVPRFCSFCNEL